MGRNVDQYGSAHVVVTWLGIGILLFPLNTVHRICAQEKTDQKAKTADQKVQIKGPEKKQADKVEKNTAGAAVAGSGRKVAEQPAGPLANANNVAKLKTQISGLQQEITQLKLKVTALELEKVGASVRLDKGKDGKEIATVNILNKWTGGKETLQLLKNVPNIQSIYIDSSQVKDTEIIPLKDLPGLSALTIMSPQVTDAALANLKDLSNLTMLFLTTSQVTDKGLTQLKGLKSLQVLALSKTQVTDAGLDALRDMKNLKSVYLIGTKVTPRAVERLKQAMPGLAIYK
jgi:hypothetical protein